MKYFSVLIIIIVLVSCTKNSQEKSNKGVTNSEKETIDTVIINWHKNASDANFDAYFNAMSDKSIFIGTDASENWNIEAFKNFSKPHFDKGKAWSFTAIDRNIYIDTKGNIAWFDELLDTWMGICRGSGVLKKTGGSWKIEHYVLSLTTPNDNIEVVKSINAKHDSIFLKKFKK